MKKRLDLRLQEKYTRALEKFVKKFSAQKGVKGILVTGSYVTGHLGPNSDIDVFVLHSERYRQAKAIFIDGIEFECAFQPEQSFYADLEKKSSSQVIRYAQGIILFDTNNVLSKISFI